MIPCAHRSRRSRSYDAVFFILATCLLALWIRDQRIFLYNSKKNSRNYFIDKMPKVRFLSPVLERMPRNDKRERETRGKLANDSIKPISSRHLSEPSKTEMIQSDDDDEDDFEDIGEEFVPPNEASKIITYLSSVVQNSLTVFQNGKLGYGDFLEKVGPTLKQFLGTQKDSKIFVSADLKPRPLRKSQNGLQIERALKFSTDVLREEASSPIRIMNSQRQKGQKHHTSVWHLLNNFSNVSNLSKRRNVTKRPVQWIRDALNVSNREESAKDIENLYDFLLMKGHSMVSSPCATVVSYSGNDPDWKKDDFQGTQFVCQDSDFLPSFKSKCLVFSFGVHEKDVSFEKAMEAKGCQVVIFALSEPKPLGSKVRIYEAGIGPKNETKVIDGKDVKYYTLETIGKKLRTTRRNISYLKLNIDGDEWVVLEQIISETPFVLNTIYQIGIKFHLHTAMLDHRLYKQYFSLLSQLPTLGFQAFASAEVLDDSDDIYAEPLLNNRTVSLTNYVSFYRF